jgi:hypothetical protein
LDWYAENILSVTGEYYGVEKTIEKEFTVFKRGLGTNPSSPNTGGSCTEVSAVSVNDEDTNPQGIAFSTDGLKMFIAGTEDDDVNEYDLPSPYCFPAVFVDATTVSGQDTGPNGIAFSTNGLKMFIVGGQKDSVYEYNLSENFDVSTASYDSAYDVDRTGGTVSDANGIENDPQDIAFSTDGLKMFIVGSENDSVYEFTLSENFDVSTASYVDAFSVNSQETTPTGIAFSTNGLKMFIVGSNDDDVNEYTLSENFDVSTASFVDAFSVASQEANPRSIQFDSSGKYMFILGKQGKDVNIYKLSENFDVSTAVLQSD